MSALRIEFGSTVDFKGWDELVTARERLLTEGWEALPYDSPERGMRAFACTKAGEPNALLRWWLYGRELEPVVKVCATWEEFVRELQFRAEEEMDKSDDPAVMQVGFVTYGRAATAGKAEVIRLPVDVLQQGGESARAALIHILMRSKHPGREALKQVLSPESRGR